MPEAQAVVGHGAGLARDVCQTSAVAIVSLVEGKQAEQIGGGAARGDGAVVVPMDGSRVVGQGGGSGMAAINQPGEDVLMGQDTGQFEVGIGDGAAGIGGRNEVAADCGRQWSAPEGGVVCHAWGG